MMNNATDVFADYTRPVKLADARPKRKYINIWAGDTDLWYGNRGVQSGTIGHKVKAGARVEIKTTSEIWVIRAVNTAGNCSFSEEFNDG